ncbi:hypothetical protein WMY93_026834 [Mugilogobius chulae]|uniref:CARMIL C-terminal domain-containing protein n=1 Tax=Mugilogobius chulae TaxID=88201 RepID=A0AAW0N355_9GOBI
MVDAAERLCPHVMKRSNLRAELLKASSSKMLVPKSFVTKTLLEQSGIDIINKISEVKLSLASFLSDRIVDEILEALSASQHTLADHLVQRGRPLVQQESVDLDVPEEKIPKRASTEILEGERLDDLETCMMTPKSKRKSIHSRMLRPVSRAFEMEFDLDKALEDVPVHVEDSIMSQTAPTSVPSKQEQRSSEEMMTLPSEEEKKLQHFTKLRPRRNKKMHSGKVPVFSSTPSQEGDQNGLMGRVDEGVDEFFSKKVTKLDSKRSSKGSESHDGEKKKKGGFLNLIKRSSKDKPEKLDKSEKNPPILLPPLHLPPASQRSLLLQRDASGRSQPADYSSSSDRSEDLRTPDSMDEPWEGSDGRGSPQGGKRHPGVQMIGTGLLAEMKAKHERRVHKSSSPDRPESNTTTKPQPPTPENKSPSSPMNKPDFSTNSSEKTLAHGENKPETAPRVRAASSSGPPGGPASPKPQVPSGTKPVLAARPTIPQKPRTTSTSKSIDESPDSPSSASPKNNSRPPTLKKAQSEKDKDGQSNKSSQEVNAPLDTVQRNSEDHGPLKPKENSSNVKDKAAKKPGSGEEADNGIILT